MLTKLEARNAAATVLELSLASDVISTSALQIRNITGLGPVRASVTTTPLGSVDAESYAGSSVGKRNIVITIGLNPNWIDQSMESLRNQLYIHFMPKRSTLLRFYSTHLPTVEVLGYVESFEPNIFSKDPEIQVSIICPSPDFVAIVATVINDVVDGDNNSPSTIVYPGSVPTGFVLKVVSSVARPAYTGTIILAHKATDPSFTSLQFTATVDATMYAEVSTVPGQKYVRKVLVAGGAITSLLGSVVNPTTWQKLQPGTNLFYVYAASSPGQAWTMTYFARYGGL